MSSQRGRADPDEVEKPRVWHFVREYLRRPETFIANQVSGHLRYEARIICHRRLPTPPESTLGPRPAVTCFDSFAAASSRHDWAYSKLRLLTCRARRFYLAQVATQPSGVIHAHYGTDAAFFLPVLRRAAMPSLVSYYGYDVSRFPRAAAGLGAQYLRRLWPIVDVHLAMTPMMASRLVALGAPEERVIVHHHGIDTRYWGEPGDSARESSRLLMVASLVPKKGHADLLRAFALLRRHYPTARLRLVGDGPLKPTLERMSRELGIALAVDFVGHLTHRGGLQDEYARAGVFVHPSVTAADGAEEGLPGAILEAMAAGLPVVATRHAGIPFAVTEGETGFLVPEGAAEALAYSIETILSHFDLSKEMGLAGQRRARADFDVRTQMDRLECLYDSARSLSGAIQSVSSTLVP